MPEATKNFLCGEAPTQTLPRPGMIPDGEEIDSRLALPLRNTCYRAVGPLFEKRQRPSALALGNYQSDVIVLLMGAEVLDLLDNGRYGGRWRQVLMPH